MPGCWSRRGRAAAVLGACALLWAPRAGADEARSRLALEYEAPSECPSRAELEEQLRARVPASWLSRSDARRFSVRIVREEDGRYGGRLEVRGASPSREADVREIRAASCEAVSRSLAVILALALDPSADEPREEEAQPAPSPPRRPAEIVRPAATRGSIDDAAPPPPTVWTWSSGLHARHLRAPEAAWGARVHVELVRSLPGRMVALGARGSYGWSDFSLLAPNAGEARFRLRTARLEACARVALASSFAVSPCAALDLGALSGVVAELRDGRKDTTGWSAAGAVLRGSWSLTPWLAAELDATLLAPFERTSFVLREPLRTVYRPPPLLFEAGAGACMSVRFH